MNTVRKCGGQIITGTFARGRAGQRVECPWCGKPVQLRQPFNAAATSYYVQLPRHNRAPKEGA
jgi:hypothetical protein